MYPPAKALAMLHQGAQSPRQEIYDTSSDHQALTYRFGGRPRAEPSGDRGGRAQAGPAFMQGIGKAYPTSAARKAAGSWAARLAGKSQRAGLQTAVQMLMLVCGAVCAQHGQGLAALHAAGWLPGQLLGDPTSDVVWPAMLVRS